MAISMKDYLVIGVSSRALFDLNDENEIYEQQEIAYEAFLKSETDCRKET